MASKDPKMAKGASGDSANKDVQGTKDENATDDRSVSSRERLRDELNSAVEAFLASGGKIEKVDPHVTADPPKKPDNNYGSRPI